MLSNFLFTITSSYRFRSYICLHNVICKVSGAFIHNISMNFLHIDNLFSTRALLLSMSMSSSSYYFSWHKVEHFLIALVSSTLTHETAFTTEKRIIGLFDKFNSMHVKLLLRNQIDMRFKTQQQQYKKSKFCVIIYRLCESNVQELKYYM